MSDDFNVHVTEFQDDDGVSWEAHHRIGSGTSVGFSEPMSRVTFKNLQTGEQLAGEVIGVGDASIEELKASLREARRAKHLEHPEEHGN